MLYRNYNVELAVLANLMILSNRTYLMDKCMEKVYSPTDEAIRNFINSQTTILLFSGPVYRPKFPKRNETSRACDLYAVLPDNKVIYVGTLISAYLAVAIHEHLLSILIEGARSKKKISEVISILERIEILTSKIFSVVRRNIRCYIPVFSEEIGKTEKEEGFRRFLLSLFPQMTRAPIDWLPNKEGEELLLAIEARAGKEKKKEKPQTRKEREYLLRQEFEML